MNNLRKIIVSLCITAILISNAAPAVFSASTKYQYADQAKALFELGLYKGTSQESFQPDLGSTLNRETGIIVLLRLFGQEDDALKMTNQDADSIIKKFSDYKSIDSWAKKQVAYAIKNNITAGYPDGTLKPLSNLKGREYCSLILRQLDVPFTFEEAGFIFAKRAGLDEKEGERFGVDTAILKDLLVGISYSALSAKNKDDKKIIQVLSDLNAVDLDLVNQFGLNQIPTTSTPIPTLSPTPVNTTDLISSVKAESGKITIVFSRDLATSPVITDFSAKQNLTSSSSSTPTITDATITGITYVSTTRTATLSTYVVFPLPTEQSIFYSVSYLNSAPISSNTFVVSTNMPVAVSSISSPNLHQILVTFGRSVDKVSAETTSNYSGIPGGEIRSATLQSDNKTVILNLFRLDDNTAPLLPDTDYSLVIQNIKDSNNQNPLTSLVQSFRASDTTTPTVKNVTVLGTMGLRVEFSEPVKSLQAENTANYTLSNNVATINSVVLDDTGIDSQSSTFATILLDRTLSPGSYELAVNNALKITDFANLNVTPQTLPFTITSDTTFPTVSSVLINSRTEVEINFSENVKAFNIPSDVFWNTDRNLTSGIYSDSIIKISDTKYIVKFLTSPLATRNIYIVVKSNNLSDYSGNKMIDSNSTYVSVPEDATPVVNSVSQTGAKTFYVFFNKDMKNDGSYSSVTYKNNITFLNSSGVPLNQSTSVGVDSQGHPGQSAILTYSDYSKKLTITLSSEIPVGSYKMTINGIQDYFQRTITSSTLDFTITDLTAPTILSRSFDATARLIYVDFSKAMALTGTHSILDPTNYRFNYGVLPQGSILETLNNNYTLRITLPVGTTISQSTYFQVGYTDSSLHTVSDSAGNTCRPDDSTATLGSSSSSGSASQISFSNATVTIVNSNQVKFVANSSCAAFDINSLTASDFVFSSDGSYATTADNFNPVGLTMDSSDTTNKTLIMIIPSTKTFNSSSAVYLLSPTSSTEIRTKDIYSRNILAGASRYISLADNKLSTTFNPNGTTNSSSVVSNIPIAYSLDVVKSRGTTVKAGQVTILSNSIVAATPASVASTDVIDWSSQLGAGQYSMNVIVQNNPINVSLNLGQTTTLSQALALIQNSLGNRAYAMQEGNRLVIKSAVLGSSSAISVSAGSTGSDLAGRFRLSNLTSSYGTDGDSITIEGQKYIFIPNGTTLQSELLNTIGVQIGWGTDATASNLVNAINNAGVLSAKSKYSSVVITKKNYSDVNPIAISYTGSTSNIIVTTIPVTSGYLTTGDKFSITFSHDMDTNTIKSGWNGTSTNVPELFQIGQTPNKITFASGYNIGEIPVFSSIPAGSIRNLDGTIEYNTSTKTLTLTITSSNASNIVLNGLLAYAPSYQLRSTASSAQFSPSFKPLMYIGTNDQVGNNLPLLLNDFTTSNW